MIIYLKEGNRRPVWCGKRPYMYDAQGAVPDGWCPGCGTEVFGAAICPRCAERKVKQ